LILTKRAILFAAGLGTRMRPLTEHTPKALIRLGDRTILDYAIDALDAAGVERIVVNTHHLADQIAAHLDLRRARGNLRAELVHIHEDVLLETGGAIVNALPLLGDEAFFAANMDAVWIDSTLARGGTARFDKGSSAIARLCEAYRPDAMDALLLLQPRTRLVSYGGGGDFGLNASGELTRDGERPYVYASLQLIHPRLFVGLEVKPFSLREQWFAGQRADSSLARVHGLVHDGDWLHVGSPGELVAAEHWLSARR
jgi:N-acetyl-alpha-D-muramate 1-phosphate uridylyltransferase